MNHADLQRRKAPKAAPAHNFYNGPMPQDADASYKLLFSAPEVVRDLVLPKVQDLKELKMTLAHRLDQWEQAYEERGLKKGRTEGRTKGRAEGKSDFLRRQLVHRFGPLPKELLARMGQASSEQLELWGLRVLDARSLDEVFAV